MKLWLAPLSVVAISGVLTVLFPGCAASNKERSLAATQVERAEALDAFNHVYKVATHVRCVNCHSTSDRPFQLEGAARHVHRMDIQRATNGLGQSCQTCHGLSNWDQPHMPPGAEGWGMPDKVKGYGFDITPHDLCAMWKDPTRNYVETDPKHPGRSGPDLITHVSDAKGPVAWSFAPGPGRSVPDESRDEFIKHVTAWVDGGMPCPN